MVNWIACAYVNSSRPEFIVLDARISHAKPQILVATNIKMNQLNQTNL